MSMVDKDEMGGVGLIQVLRVGLSDPNAKCQLGCADWAENCECKIRWGDPISNLIRNRADVWTVLAFGWSEI